MGARRIAAAIFTLVLSTTNYPAVAKKNTQAKTVADSSTLSLSGPFQELPGSAMDPTDGILLWQVSHKPELMNIQYLRYYLGEPDRQTTNIGVRSHAYYWYDRHRNKKCELFQEHDQPGQIVESVMVMHLPPGEFDFKVMEKSLGPPARSFYDHSADPTRMYSFAPNTTLSMSSPPNTFAITRATVSYLGAPLPEPSFEDLKVAHDSYIAKIQQKAVGKNVNWHDALAGARERVQMHPTDAEAHIGLAQVLKKTGKVHEAISEYKLALSLNKYNDAVRQQCIQGLKDLYVLPKNFSEPGTTGVAGKNSVQAQ